MKYLLLTLFLNLFIFSFNAQNKGFTEKDFPDKKNEVKKALQSFKAGDALFVKGPSSFIKALQEYKKAYDFNPENALLNFQIGYIYNAINKKSEATPYLEKAITLDAKLKPKILFILAEALHLNGDFDKAIEKFKEVIQLAKSNMAKSPASVKKYYIDDIAVCELKIRQCENAKILTSDTLIVEYENLGKKVNSNSPDYSPVLNATEDIIVFATRRNTGDNSRVPFGDVYPYEDIFFSTKRNNNEWTAAIPLEGKVNSAQHEAPVWISSDGKKMFIYKTTGSGDLYETNFLNNLWTKPKKIKQINSKYRETHASMTLDGSTIYFSSAQKKSSMNNSIDIFMVSYNEETKSWNKPLNLGNIINTPYAEECPFISEDGNTLYFSSQGHNSMGGFDFFKSVKVNGQWTTPQNLGYPVNTPANESFICIVNNGKHAYFDSDRKDGFGEKDIYKMNIYPEELLPVQVTIIDSKTNQPVAASIRMYRNGNDSLVEFSMLENGTYAGKIYNRKHYSIEISQPGYENYKTTYHSKLNQSDSYSKKPIEITIKLTPTYTQPDVSAEFSEAKEDLIPQYINFDFASYALSVNGISELNKLRNYMLKNAISSIRLEGHTDSKGSPDYNRELSKRRVEIIAEWFKFSGLGKLKIEKGWFGKSKPLVPNTNEDGTDNPVNRQKNRRVEIILIKK
jgi:outer membrane protein OmpA-like peptidoglycan-associated protein/tetratricopeptide (TPR) repeat protein